MPKVSLGVLLQLLLVVLILPMLPLLITWRWDWWEGWVYALAMAGGFVVSRVLAARRHPDLLAERARGTQHENTEPWDKWLAPMLGWGGTLIPLVAGLEARLLQPSAFGLAVKAAALAAILAGYSLATWALVENRFFSGVVRIQTERGHRVVSSGPYRYVRHPGYVGGLLANLATPLFLDALWAYVPVLFVAVVYVIRTALEDRTLQERLEGYRDYAAQVRYRLLPGVW